MIIIIIIINNDNNNNNDWKKIAINSFSGEKNREKILVQKKKVGEKFSHLQIMSLLPDFFFPDKVLFLYKYKHIGRFSNLY